MKELIADAWVRNIFLIHIFSYSYTVKKRMKKRSNGNKNSYGGVATRHLNPQPKSNKSTNLRLVMFISSFSYIVSN
jgi:hypothetical protein